MNYEDERYIRLFTRDTATWKFWSWEARCLFMAMLRKVDRAGVIDTGKMEKIQAIALICECPKDVVAKGLPELTESETVMIATTAILMPNFIKAQETKQTDAARQRESREKRAAMAASDRIYEALCHTPSQMVTDGHSILAVPSRAVPLKEGQTQAFDLVTQGVKEKPSRKPPDPEAELVKFLADLSEGEREIFRAYEAASGVTLGPDWELLKLVRKKMKAHPVDELCAAIKGHCADPWNREKKRFSLRAIFSDASVIASNALKGRGL